jgi:hypothetical protein
MSQLRVRQGDRIHEMPRYATIDDAFLLADLWRIETSIIRGFGIKANEGFFTMDFGSSTVVQELINGVWCIISPDETIEE